MHACLPRSVHYRQRSVDIYPIHLIGMPHPKAIISGDMEDNVASRHPFAQRLEIAQIAFHTFRFQEADIVGTGARPRQQAKFGSLLLKQFGNVTADKSGCASDKRLHIGMQPWERRRRRSGRTE